MDYSPDWKPTSNKPEFDVAFRITTTLLDAVEQQIPDLAALTPLQRPVLAMIHFGQDWVGIIIRYPQTTAGMVPRILEIEDTDRARFEGIACASRAPTHSVLYRALGPDYFGSDRFAYIGPCSDGMISWAHLSEHLIEWLNRSVLPAAFRLNQTRVLRAIPSPPQFNFSFLADALWVLESDEGMVQGTAFTLSGVGLVTCDHVIRADTHAFRASACSAKLSTRIIAREAQLDLAILEVKCNVLGGLHRGSSDAVSMMDHIAIAGFPNYRLGDTGIFVPGLVVGFRPVSGIRRLLTNAAIVAGMSGGPVVNGQNQVIGVAATGADMMENAQSTEHHGIIPIDALAFLQGSGR